MIRISVSSKGFAARRFTAVLWSPPRLQPPSHRFPRLQRSGPQVYRRQVSTPSSRLTAALKPYKFKKEFPTTQHQRRVITGTTPTPRHRRRKTTYATPSGTTPTPRKGAPTSATPPRGAVPNSKPAPQGQSTTRDAPPDAMDAAGANCCLQHGRRPLRGPRGQNSIIRSTEGTVLQMVASRADIGK